MDPILSDLFKLIGQSIGINPGLLSTKTWHEKYFSLCVKLALIRKGIITDDIIHGDLSDVIKTRIKTILNLNCFKKGDYTLVTPANEPVNLVVEPPANLTKISLYLTFYSKEMVIGLVRKKSVWEIFVREQFGTLDQDMIKYFEEIINALEEMRFPNARPKMFVLKIGEDKIIPLKKFNNRWVFKPDLLAN